jgi:oxygen-dependent protoporphyrinogen oxidase
LIAIVGGGITGLTLAHELEAAGRDFVVLEASDRPGGAIRTCRADGHILEAGPQRTRLTPSLHSLVSALSLENRLVFAPEDLPLHIYSRGRLRAAPLDRAGLLRTDLLSPAQKVRLLAEPLASTATHDETVASYLIRRFGRAAPGSPFAPAETAAIDAGPAGCASTDARSIPSTALGGP